MNATLRKVHNRGAPPTEFIRELIDWGKGASDALFTVNSRRDIYSLVSPMLGPFTTFKHQNAVMYRKAVMCEVLRVLAGFESSWNWKEGRDKTNSKEVDSETWSVGIFQISPNSRWLDPSLLRYLKERYVDRYGQHVAVMDLVGRFRADMVSDHKFAFTYASMLLRVNLNHNGPVKRGEILQWLSRDAVAEFLEAFEGKS